MDYVHNSIPFVGIRSFKQTKPSYAAGLTIYLQVVSQNNLNEPAGYTQGVSKVTPDF